MTVFGVATAKTISPAEGGADKLRGEAGDDFLDGKDGAGNDLVNGGDGRDGCKSDPGDTVRNCP